MGFTVKQGNNMDINLQPDTREEPERLFPALSADGKVGMPLQDMFPGCVFGKVLSWKWTRTTSARQALQGRPRDASVKFLCRDVSFRRYLTEAGCAASVRS